MNRVPRWDPMVLTAWSLPAWAAKASFAQLLYSCGIGSLETHSCSHGLGKTLEKWLRAAFLLSVLSLFLVWRQAGALHSILSSLPYFHQQTFIELLLLARHHVGTSEVTGKIKNQMGIPVRKRGGVPGGWGQWAVTGKEEMSWQLWKWWL